MESLITTASAYIRAGLSAIPTASDKRPSCAWRPFTSRKMSDREIETFFVRAEGIGIVCGKVSGNLELLDFEWKFCYTIIVERARAQPMRRSPSCQVTKS